MQRLHQVLERSAADRSGRRVRRASQWDLEDYRAEYDRLNLELSKLRQQLTAFQDRDSQQVGVIKGELQKLAELILTSAQSKGASPEPERLELSAKRFGAPGFPQGEAHSVASECASAHPARSEIEAQCRNTGHRADPGGQFAPGSPCAGWPSGPGGGLGSFEPRIAGANNPPGGNGSHFGAEKRVRGR